eukprot:366410-Chlamydomonas_euryale.AAC.5
MDPLDAWAAAAMLGLPAVGRASAGKFRDVLVAHAKLSEPKGASHPSRNALMMLFLASAIPFIVFGFLDNFIMLTVGEEIDAACPQPRATVFGARLGLTTLASAGLGNCVADVIGVSAAKAIEQDAVLAAVAYCCWFDCCAYSLPILAGGLFGQDAVKRLPFIKIPKLSREQYSHVSIRGDHEQTSRTAHAHNLYNVSALSSDALIPYVPAVAKATGSTAGVLVGCILGVVPLALAGNFFH